MHQDVTNFRAIFSVLLRQNSLSLFQQQMFCQNLEGEVQLPELIGDVVQLQRETAVRQAAAKDHFTYAAIISRFWYINMIRILGNASVRKVLVQTFFFVKH